MRDVGVHKFSYLHTCDEVLAPAPPGTSWRGVPPAYLHTCDEVLLHPLQENHHVQAAVGLPEGHEEVRRGAAGVQLMNRNYIR